MILSEEKEQLQRALESFQMTHEDIVEEHKTVVKQLKDADNQLVACIRQIQSLNHDKEWKEKELDDLEAPARALVDVIDPAASERTLLERLRDVPHSIVSDRSPLI